MASFEKAYNLMIFNEGGYVDHTVDGDRGGQTYAGIARKFHPDWAGWDYIDDNDTSSPELKEHVVLFYKDEFWDEVRGDDIISQLIANSIFDFAVNAGVDTASKLAQQVVGERRDGVIGPITLAAINEYDSLTEDNFLSNYALAKISRYVQIVGRDRSQGKFLLGWLRRSLKDIDIGSGV